MKFRCCHLVAGLLFAAASPTSFAADSATVSVKGTITPGTCDISGGTTIDLGDVAFKNLTKDASTHLVHNRPVSLTVSCYSGTRFSLKAIDDGQPDSIYEDAPAGFAFGLGKQSDQSIGYWTLSLNEATSGEHKLIATASSDNGVTWSLPEHAYLGTEAGYSVGFAKEGDDVTKGPTYLNSLNVSALLNVFIAPSEKLNGSEVIPMSGAARIELYYP